jgi:hypothetical protein
MSAEIIQFVPKANKKLSNQEFMKQYYKDCAATGGPDDPDKPPLIREVGDIISVWDEDAD